MPNYEILIRRMGRRIGKALSRAEVIHPDVSSKFSREMAVSMEDARRRLIEDKIIIGGIGGAAVGGGAGYYGGRYLRNKGDGHDVNHSIDLLGHNLTIGDKGMRWK